MLVGSWSNHRFCAEPYRFITIRRCVGPGCIEGRTTDDEKVLDELLHEDDDGPSLDGPFLMGQA